MFHVGRIDKRRILIFRVAFCNSLDEKDIEKIFRKLDSLEKKFGLAIQLFNSENIVSWRHILYACNIASANWRKGFKISRKLSLEILLYTSCQHQIDVGVKRVGLRPGDRYSWIVIVGENIDDNVIGEILDELDANITFMRFDIDPTHIMRVYGVYEEELKLSLKSSENVEEALLNCIIPRMNMVVLREKIV